MKRMMIVTALVTFALALVTSQVYALSITPDDCIIGDNCWTMDGDPNGLKLDEVIDLTGTLGLEELYKADVGDANNPATMESGSLAGSYETEFFNTLLDPMDATITYVGSGDVADCPTCYLMVKDGNASPSWYLYELKDDLFWDGMEEIVLTDFWPRTGAISHVSIYGTSTSVPEPATMLLFGTGLIGLVGFSRRKRN